MTSKGRKTKLNSEVQKGIVEAIQKGAFDWVATQSQGIGQSTFYRWLEAGAQGNRYYWEFWEDVQQARAQARKQAEIRVYEENPLSWLRLGPGRTRPGEPGWTESLALTGGDGGSISITIADLAKMAKESHDDNSR